MKSVVNNMPSSFHAVKATEAMNTLYRLALRKQQRYRTEQVVHIHRTLCRSVWPRGFGELNPSPHSWIFTSVSPHFQPSLIFIYFRYGPNTVHPFRTYPICDAPLSWSALRSFAPLQSSRQNHRSYVWTEALSGIIFVPAQKLSGIVWIWPKRNVYIINPFSPKDDQHQISPCIINAL